MKNYFKWLVYSVLELFSSLINIVLALGGVQPSFSMGVEWLVILEANRITNEASKRVEDKDEMFVKAKDMTDQAKEGVKDIVEEF